MDQSLGQLSGKPLRAVHFLYHELRPGGSRYSYALDTAKFKEHIALFGRLRQLGDSVLWPEVTFDDGHLSDFEYALPVLQAHQMSAHFFITVGWTGNRQGYMGWEELRSLQASGQEIGTHGWSHTLLTHCNSRDLQEELRRPKQILEDKLGARIDSMSLPGGRYNRRVLIACKEAGYASIYTSIPRADDLPARETIGRINIRGDMGLEWLREVLDPGENLVSRLERQYRIKAAAKSLLGDRLYERIWAVLNHKMAEATPNEDTARYQ